MRQVWKVIKLMMFGAVTVMALAACGGGGGGDTSITGATLKSILVTPANPSIAKSLTMQFTATGTYSDGTSHLITSSVTWTSGTTSVATVAASGLATGIEAGSSVITATSGSVSGNTTLTVTAATLQSILVLPDNPSIDAGQTMQFTAVGTYSDGISHFITSFVTWTSGTTSVATVAASGLATGIGAGSSVITAALGSVSGNTTLTVTSLTPSFSSAGTWTGANGNGDSVKVVHELVTYIYSAAWELTFTFYSGAGSPCGGRVFFAPEFDNYPWTNNGREFAASVDIVGGGTIHITFRGTSPNSAVVTLQADAQLCGKPVDNTWTVTKQ